MKPLPTNLGTSRKNLTILGGILVIGLPLVYWANSGTDGPPQAAGKSSAVPAVPTVAAPSKPSAAPSGPKLQTRGGNGRTVEDFRPSIKLPEGVDVSRIDPRLKTDLLARVRAVPDQGGTRSVFEFYTPPAPPPPVQPIKPVQVTTVAPPPPAPRGPTGPPPPPPIPLKYYGFAGPAGNRTLKGCFLDGEDMIFVVAANDMILNRYRIIRLGLLDAEVEDTVTKNRQTIKLTPENDA
jgi:hypothetical protein